MAGPTPQDILEALKAHEADLSESVGEEWPQIEPRYRELRVRLEQSTGPIAMLAAADVAELFAPYEKARILLREAVARQTETGQVLLGLGDVADQLQFGPAVGARFREAALATERTRYVLASGPTKAKSLKFANLDFDFGNLSELVAGLIVTTVKDITTQTDVLLVVAAGRLILKALYKATTVALDEREATVFYGFAQVAEEKLAKERAILAGTNKVRAEVHLKPLDLTDLRNALFKLEQIKAIKSVQGEDGIWRIVEGHNVPERK